MRSVLITGTSTGIGQATAVTLAARGWRVFATMRNLKKRDLLEQALKEAGVRDGVEVEQLDVTDAASIGTAVASMLSQTGNKLDAVVHNAGVAAAGALEDVKESELRRVMETNFFGVLELTRALLPTFRAQSGGASSSSRAKPPSWASPRIRSTALEWAVKDGPRRSPTSSNRSGLTSSLSSPAPIALRSGTVRRAFSRQAAPIMHGCSMCSGRAMHTPQEWRAIRGRWHS